MVPDPDDDSGDDDGWNGDTDKWDTHNDGTGSGEDGGDERSSDPDDSDTNRDRDNTTHDDRDTGSGDGPNSFGWHVSRITDRFGELLVFALIPLLTTLLDTQSVRQALRQNRGDFSITFEFVLPSPLLDLWSFADPPEPADPQFPDGGYGASAIEPSGGTAGGDSGVGSIGRTTSSGTDLTVESHLEIMTAPFEALGLTLVPILVLSVLAYAAVFAVLEAIYVGGIDRRLENRRSEPIKCIRRYTPKLFAYTLLVLGATLFLIPVLLVAPLLFLLALPAALVLGYLFYAVPFLFVVDDAAFLEAFERSLEFALEGGVYFWFAVKHVVITVGASVVLSILVSVGGPIGFVLAVTLTIPLALVLTAATTSFLRELVELADRDTPDWGAS
ncbi:hypothetical protein [Halostagnicola bangensis]